MNTHLLFLSLSSSLVCSGLLGCGAAESSEDDSPRAGSSLLDGSTFPSLPVDSAVTDAQSDLVPPGPRDSGATHGDDADASDGGTESSPVRLAITVHLEGWPVEEETAFRTYVAEIRERAELFESYGARLSLESKELTSGIISWEDNVLLELQSRGHDVGIHADLGGRPSATYTATQMADDLRERAEQLEDLGITANTTSGICSDVDWVQAAIDADMKVVTGIVAYCLMSLPEEDRPEEFRDCEDARACHDAYPLVREERFEPWRTSDGLAWTEHDPEGELVIVPTSGALPCLAETATDGSATGCDFTEEDIDLYIAELEYATSLVEPGHVTMMVHAWSFGRNYPIVMWETFLQRVRPYIESGDAIWSTTREIHAAYVE